MRIGLDATPLIHPYGGVSRYVTELTVALAERFPEDEFHLLTDQSGCHFDRRLVRSNVIIAPPTAPSLGGKWWSLRLPWELRRRRIDVFHGTNFSVPYLPLTPALMTLHDLSPWKDPPLRPPGSERVRRRTPRLFRLARLILTPTQAISVEAGERFGIPASKRLAIHHAPTPALHGGVAESLSRDREGVVGYSHVLDGGIKPPYLLYLGSGEPRKNLPTLIESWRIARRDLPELKLVLAGVGQFQAPSEPGLCRLAQVTDSQAARLLSGAAAFVYPSLYEGFGLPVVEAMHHGVPVITSQDPAIVEAAGGAALHVDVTSASILAKTITTLTTNPDQNRRLRKLGFERAASLSWTSTAEQTRAAYARATR